jgi:hypothetical protein
MARSPENPEETTMKRAIALTIATLATACGGAQKLTPDEARSAMPVKEQAQVGTPSQSSAATSASGSGELAAALVNANEAPFFDVTAAYAMAVNGSVAWTLDVLKAVVALPPTTCAEDTCTWGPGTSAFDFNTWKLVVTKEAAGQYSWALEARPNSDASAAFATLISGTAFPTGNPRIGSGNFALDVDAAATLDRSRNAPPPGTGKIQVSYDNTDPAAVTVKVNFLGTEDQSNLAQAQKVNAAYQFIGSADGGDLQIVSVNASTSETVQFRSRWIGTGEGRGDAKYDDGHGNTATSSECWQGNTTAFNMVYSSTIPAGVPGLPADMGGVASCDASFSAPAYPTITAP